MSDFIGRNIELVEISDFLNSEKKQVNVCLVHGEGGVGKSSLLREFIELNGYTENLLFYDFDYPLYHSSENIRTKFSYDLGMDNFRKYEASLAELNNFKDTKAGTSSIKNAYQNTSSSWAKEFASVVHYNKRFIFFDTLDGLSKLQLDKFSKFFLQYLPDHTKIIVAGRYDEIKALSETLANTSVSFTLVGVKPFNDKEAEQYITEKLLSPYYYNIDPWPEFDWANSLKKLCRNLPILLDLSLDNLYKSQDNLKNENPFLSKALNLTAKLKDNKNGSNVYKDFEKEVVLSFLESKDGYIKELIYILAHSWPLAYSDLPNFFRDIKTDEVEKIIQLASKVSYIKTDTFTNEVDEILEKSFRLQDVMREMIVEHAWPVSDEKKEKRIKYSEMYLSLIDEKIAKYEKLSGNDLSFPTNLDLYIQKLKVQQVKHLVFIDPVKGINLCIDYSNGSNNRYTESSFINELLIQVESSLYFSFGMASIRKYLQEDESAVDVVANFLIKKMDFYFLRNRQSSNSAYKDLNRILKLDSLPLEVEVKILDELASRQARLGKFNKGLIILDLAEKKCFGKSNKTPLISILTTRGWLFRLMGSYSEACEAYASAFDIIIERKYSENRKQYNDNASIIEVATLLQTWSYSIALERNYPQAVELAEEAIKMFRQVDYTVGEGRVESVLGRIKIENNMHDEAMRHFENAERMISTDDSEWYSKILVGKVYSLLTKTTVILEKTKVANEKNLVELQKAEGFILEAEKLNIGSERVELEYLKGLLYFRKSLFGEAMVSFDESEKAALSENNFSFVLRSLIGKIRISIKNLQNKDKFIYSDFYENELDQYLQKFDEKRCDLLLLYIARKSIADLKFLEGAPVDDLLVIYTSTLPKIGELYRHFPNDLLGQLGRTQEVFELYAVSSGDKEKYVPERIERVRNLSRKLAEFWQSDKSLIRNFPNSYAIMRHWCSEDLDTWNEW